MDERLQSEAIQLEAKLVGKGAKRTRRFRMLANTGQPFDRMFGRAVIDLAGVESLPARGLPMLLQHDDLAPAGVADQMEKTEEGIFLSGDLLLSQDAGKQVASLSDDGFPLTASVGLRVLSREELVEGAEAEVNGQELAGPVEIWRQTRLTETSFITANPADPATFAEALKRQSRTQATQINTTTPQEGTPMDQLKELLASLPEEWHGLAARLLTEGKDPQAIREAVYAERLAKVEGERDAALASAATLTAKLAEASASASASASAPPAPAPNSTPSAASGSVSTTPNAGPDAAALAAAVAASAATLARLKEQSGHPGVAVQLSDAVPEDLSGLPQLERFRREWDSSEAIQGEFCGQFGAYVQIRRREEVAR